MSSTKPWKRLARIAEIRTKWVTIFADSLQDDDGNRLEYWHVDRADSVIVIVRQGGKFLLPPAQYRPGIDARTLDFAGGRIASNEEPQAAALRVLEKELGITLKSQTLKPICDYPLDVDSSFSTQMVWGFFVELPEGTKVIGEAMPCTINQLIAELHCMQCRVLFLEWQLKR